MQKMTFAVLISTLSLLIPHIASANPAADMPVIPGIYEISCAEDPDFILDLKTCTVKETDRHSLQLYRSLDVNQQKFYIELLPGSSYRISNLSSAEALTATGLPDSAAPGALPEAFVSSGDCPVSQTEVCLDTLQRSPGSAAPGIQSWQLRDTGDGRFYISSLQSGLFLTLNSDFAFNGASVSLARFTGERNQKWTFRKTWVSPTNTADTDLVNPYGEDGQYHDLRLLIRCGAETETLTGEDFSGWMMQTEEHQLLLDTEKLTRYVEGLAEKYDTQGQPRTFHTSWGKDITLYKGDFGWKLDVEKTVEQLQEASKHEGGFLTTPAWKHRGTSFSKGKDIGSSYVEVDLVNQKVWLYKDGEKLLETDCVSGTLNTERQTPGGVYSIYYMKSPAVLNGPGYSSPVEYWMPFNGGIGLHDANWRGAFGGDIYKTNGSHGCINLPLDAAKRIYETVDIGYPVVCYN